jgi:hypothetical protein
MIIAMSMSMPMTVMMMGTGMSPTHQKLQYLAEQSPRTMGFFIIPATMIVMGIMTLTP